MEKVTKSEKRKMNVTLKVDSPQKGKKFITSIGGQTITFQIVDIINESPPKKSKENLLKEMETIRAELKSDNFFYIDPTEPAIPENDWEIYKK